MPIFRSRHTENLDTVAGKLDAARGALAALEAERSERALAAALVDEDDGRSIAAVNERVLRQRAIVETLEIALQRAQQIEQKRLADAADAAEKARVRAVQQHTGRVIGAAAEFRAAVEKMAGAWRDMLAPAAKLQILLSPDENRVLFGTGGSLEHALAEHVRLEFARIAAPKNALTNERHFPVLPRPGEYARLLPYATPAHAVDPIDVLLAAKFKDTATIISRAQADTARRQEFRKSGVPAELPADEPPVTAMDQYHADGDAAVARAHEAASSRSPTESVAEYRRQNPETAVADTPSLTQAEADALLAPEPPEVPATLKINVAALFKKGS
jgi:hypothetical protein